MAGAFIRGAAMKNGIRSTLIASLSTLLSAQLVLAQARPMPPDPYDANQHQQPVAGAVPPGNTDPATSSVPVPAANGYPAAEVQAVPIAKARAAAARVHADQAQDSVHWVVDQLKEDFEYSSDLVASVRAEKSAYDRLNAARDRVLKQVAQDKEYQTLRSLVKDLSDRIEVLKSRKETNKIELLASAELKLAYATKVSDMENDALKADAEVQTAKANLVDASTRVSEMRASFQRSVRRNEKFVSARKDWQDARVDKVATAAMVEGALDAREIALRYAYWLHRYDPYTYSGGVSNGYPIYIDNGYGYGSGINYGGYGVQTTTFDPFFGHRR